MNEIICPECGSVNNVGDKYCNRCGYSLGALNGSSQSGNSYQPAHNYEPNNQPNSSYAKDNYRQPAPPPGNYNQENYRQPVPRGRQESPVTVGKWIGIMLLMGLVPIVGFIIGLVMAFNDGNESLKNWGKATLILTVIGIVLYIVILAIFGTMFYSVMQEMPVNY